MRIRWKLLILLLVIALVPLVFVSALHRVSTRRLGMRLAEGRREILTEDARRQLQEVVGSYGRILRRDQQILELMLRVQAREVEDRLGRPPPPSPGLYFARDYDQGVNVPADLAPSPKYRRVGPGGQPAPIAVSYDQQVYVLAPGVSREAVADAAARLSTMPQAYRALYEQDPAMVYWQYTGLEEGLHACYPGHGGYPPGYDPRQRLWYRQAKETGRLGWLPPTVEVSTRTVALSVCMPVRRPDGSFAGATAIDVPIPGILGELKVPEQWAGDVAAKFVVPEREDRPSAGRLRVLAQAGLEEYRQDWRAPPVEEYLESEDAAELAKLTADATGGGSGVRALRHAGRRALWAYGPGQGEERAFPVLILPEARVVARAVEAETYVWDKTVEGLKVSALVLLGVVLAVVIAALVSSRSVTRPVGQLAEAAGRLAAGDYDARVRIRTRDELEKLGGIFNDMGPKLREREQMKRSLALAMEVQQHLLPQEAPALPGFEIAGTSLYCDETGGDYYDFIDLVKLGEGKLGIAVGDVTGHGIGAALLMASARAVLRSHAGRHGADLGGLFDAINVDLVRDTGDERFVTLFYGVLDAAGRSLRWTSGGHDPAFWLRRSTGRIEELPNTGIPLGVIEEATYTCAGPVTLDGGDVIVIGTDGIWEARDPAGDMFGKQRLGELLSEQSGASAEAIYTAVVNAVTAFRGARPQEDDITLVVIKAL